MPNNDEQNNDIQNISACSFNCLFGLSRLLSKEGTGQTPTEPACGGMQAFPLGLSNTQVYVDKASLR